MGFGSRARLPARRPSVTMVIEWRGMDIVVTAGFDPASDALREVFAQGPRFGSDLDSVVADACVVISLALQHGARPGGMLRSLGTVPVMSDGVETEAPASVVGAIVAALVGLERDA